MRRLRQGQCACASLLTPRRPCGPCSRLPPRRPGSRCAILLSWPEDLLAAGGKFSTGTHSPTGAGGSQGLAGVSHPALLAHTFGLPLLSLMGPSSAKNYVSLKLHSQQITISAAAAGPPPCLGPGGATGVGAFEPVPSPAAVGPGTKPASSWVFLKAAPSLGMG